MSFEDSAQDFRFIRFYPRSCALRTAFAAQDVIHEIIFAQRDTGLYAVNHDTDGLTVRLTENLYPEIPAERIHYL